VPSTTTTAHCEHNCRLHAGIQHTEVHNTEHSTSGLA
jgi:hypothetical protein